MSVHKPKNLPAPASMTAAIDVRARLRVFDFDGSLVRSSRDAWEVLEPEIRSISDAYWQQWLRCFADQRNWAPDETEKMVDLGVVFLRNRFLDTAGNGWIESIERSVAAAYDSLPFEIKAADISRLVKGIVAKGAADAKPAAG